MQNHHQPTLPRKLAATLFADVQGYSRMMGRDEDATHRKTISGLRLFEEKIASYGGRIVRSAGDGVANGRFLILSHPRVSTYVQRKAADHDRWIAGMRKFRQSIIGEKT